MTTIKLKVSGFFKPLLNFFTSGAAQKDLNLALTYVDIAIPYIADAGLLVSTLDPNVLSPESYNRIKDKYPKFFDGSLLTNDELKNYLFAIAATMLTERFPILNSTVARTAIQLAYLKLKATGLLPNIPGLDNKSFGTLPPKISPLISGDTSKPFHILL